MKEPLPVVLRKLLRLSFKSGKRLFCWSVIWGVQLKSKWIFDQSSIVFDQQAVWKNRLILLKAQWTFFQCLIWKFFYLKKTDFSRDSRWCHVVLKELLRLSDGLTNPSFCRSEDLRVQLSPTEKLVKAW